MVTHTEKLMKIGYKASLHIRAICDLNILKANANLQDSTVYLCEMFSFLF